MSIHVFDQGSSAEVEQVYSLIIHTLETMIDTNHCVISSKQNVISTILPFAISLEQDGRQGLLDVAVRALRGTSESASPKEPQAKRYMDALFEESSAPSLNRAIALILPYRIQTARKEHEVARWATAVLAVPYTEEVGWSVVEVALQSASKDSLRPHIPIGVWALFKEQPTLQPISEGRRTGTGPDIIRHVRGLGDLEILKSYFLLVWSEWDRVFYGGLDVMEMLIREDFCGTGMGQHREDLVHRLDHVLEELGRGPGYFRQRAGYRWYGNVDREIDARKEQYRKLKDVLLEVEAAEKTPTRASPRTLFSQ